MTAVMTKFFNTRRLWLAVLGMAVSGPVFAQNSSQPMAIEQQGSFDIGGTVVTAPGTFDVNKPMTPDGQTLHGDHAYVFYQLPQHAKAHPLIFLHGAGQSKQTWETTPDGRDGF